MIPIINSAFSPHFRGNSYLSLFATPLRKKENEELLAYHVSQMITMMELFHIYYSTLEAASSVVRMEVCTGRGAALSS